jgi:dipeptidyl aminopeptidase/acylaminoacyl peptidase
MLFGWIALVLVAAAPLRAELLAHPDDPQRRVEYFIGRPEGKGPWPTILFIHGHQGPPRPGAQGSDDVLNRFAKRGVLAVVVSQPGYGDSSGPPDFCGPFTQRAVSAVIDKLRRDGMVASGKLVIQGVSRGATVAAMIGAYDRDIGGLILIGGEYDLTALALDSSAQGIRAAIRENLLAESGGSAEALRARNVLAVAADIKVPTLILHGEADENTSPEHARQLADSIRRSGGDVQLVTFPGVAHSIPMEERRKYIEPFLTRRWGETPPR